MHTSIHMRLPFFTIPINLSGLEVPVNRTRPPNHGFQSWVRNLAKKIEILSDQCTDWSSNFDAKSNSGWWLSPTPLKSMSSSIGMVIPNWMEKSKMFQTTNQDLRLSFYPSIPNPYPSKIDQCPNLSIDTKQTQGLVSTQDWPSKIQIPSGNLT